MAETAVSLAVEKMGDLLIQKASFLRGVEGQVKKLKDEFQRMQSVLNDAVNEKANANHERMSNWMSQLREVAQSAEDAIETFIFKVDTQRRSRGLLRPFSPLPNHVYHLNRPGKEIGSIRSRLRLRKGERYNFQLLGERRDSSKRSEGVGWQHKLAPWQEDEDEDEDEDEVGLEEDVEILLQKAIFGEREGLSIASIVGMGGIGKTTLASKLYNHAAIADRFDCRAWVCVSSEFRPKEVIKVLIRQLLDLTEDKHKVLLKNMEQLDELTLQHVLYQFLQGRRYFIVLDDVWEDADWKSLASAFPDEEASRLLLTTRNRDITKHTQYVHEMKILDPDKSWQLFLKMVFVGIVDNKCPEHLENIGREILKKCNGLPLAIKEVGMQLEMKRQSKSEWEEVLKTMDLSVMTAVLELSYHKLPPKLKLCFLGLGFCKEGATIRAEKLVQIWIAGGMVPQAGGKNATMEEIARSYLDKLINRNMVQVKDMTKDNRVKNCYINDILRRISITKAKAEISLETLRKEDNSRPFDRPRHCAIHCSRKRFIHSMNQDKHLHSLFFHGGGNFNGSPFYWKSFKLLRVLDFEDFGLKKLPDTIGALTRLRYLGLRNNYIQELPHSLGRLKNLEVLDIALNFMVEVPNVMWKMDSLRHLYMSDIICKTPLKIDALKNLQTLTYISVDNWTYELSALQMMTSLRKLGIEELDINSDVSKLFTSLAKLENLVCLNLRGFRFRSMPSLDELGILHRLTQLKLDGLFTTLPSANNFPPNISYLTLVNTSLDEDPMPVLEKLSKLSYLKLQNAYTGDKMVISQDGFPKLQVLCIGELWHLRNIEVGNGAMPMLKRLEINSCPYLESLLKEVGLMTNLQELKMVTTTTIASKLRDSGIVSNVPYVDIQC